MASGPIKEVLPPTLSSNSQPPNLFDGATRLYISYICPYAQRVWIARNYKVPSLFSSLRSRHMRSAERGTKISAAAALRLLRKPRACISEDMAYEGLQNKIELVAINLQDKPEWFREKVYPPNKVPALEHNKEVRGESLDLLKYLDKNFEGPKLLPDDPERQAFAEELLASSDSIIAAMFAGGRAQGDGHDIAGPAFDKIEEVLGRFDDGPFFLGQYFSMVDMTYAPFTERFQAFFAEVKNCYITEGRPKLKLWIEELNKIDAYAQTWGNRHEQLSVMKKKFRLE